MTIIAWLEESQNEQVNKQTQSIKNHIDDIVLCYQQIEEIYQDLSSKMEPIALNALCTAWQHQHLGNQTKGASKKYHQDELNFWVNYAESMLGNESEAIVKQVFDSLDNMTRSSSLIEMVNSRIRPYLNSCKSQITQEARKYYYVFS